MAMPATGTWSSSIGAGSARAEAVFRLHRLHFVERKGNAGVHEIIDERYRQNRSIDAERAKEHTAKMQAMYDKHDERIRTGRVLSGSMSRRPRAQRDAMEEARTDPAEAVEKKKKHLRRVQRDYVAECADRTERVATMPYKTIRSKEERDAWEEARQDIHEAQAQAANVMRARSEDYRKERLAMKERVDAMPKSTYWSKADREKIEDLRQDPDEALARMKGHMKALALTSRDERAAMHQRVAEQASTSFRAKHELEAWEEARQDLGEAQESAKKSARSRAEAYREERDSMLLRVGAQPQKTFRSRAERDAIEELRQDPDEARERMTAHMRGLARSYNDTKRSMAQRVHAIPAMSFRSKEERDRHDVLRAPQLIPQSAR